MQEVLRGLTIVPTARATATHRRTSIQNFCRLAFPRIDTREMRIFHARPRSKNSRTCKRDGPSPNMGDIDFFLCTSDDVNLLLQFSTFLTRR